MSAQSRTNSHRGLRSMKERKAQAALISAEDSKVTGPSKGWGGVGRSQLRHRSLPSLLVMTLVKTRGSHAQ